MSDRKDAIVGETGHRYFTQMLNMAEDDLDPFQYRLLSHYVRWAGYGGIAQETIKETARRTKMSERKVRASRDQLVEMGYLHVYEPTLKERGDGLPAIIEVLDRWYENVQRYSTREPDANMHQVVREPNANIHQLPDANMHHIEEQENLEEKESPAPNKGADVLREPKKRVVVTRTENFKLLALESFGIADADALDGETAVLLNKLERWLKTNSPGATVETLKAFYLWYDKNRPGAARPRDSAKFGVHFIAFRQQHMIVHKAPPEVVTAGKRIIPVETDWRREPVEVGT